MKQTITPRPILLAILALMAGATSAIAQENESEPVTSSAVTLTLVNPQELVVVDAGQSEPVTLGGVGDAQILHASWKVKSNGGFYIDFTGNSKSDVGEDLGYPRLVKQDIDAAGVPIPNRYDHLNTTYGAEISNIGSLNITERVEWSELGDHAVFAGGGEAPAVADYELQLPPAGHHMGVMPHDLIGSEGQSEYVEVRLYVKGESDVDRQAGLYTGEVTLTITPYMEYQPGQN